jgi:cytochrome c biogenesis protein CcmG, thiol:disulfide interchange protein DsbE
MSTTVSDSNTTTSPADTQQPRQSRVQQVAIVAAVALLIVAAGVWLARSQGAGDLGSGGVNSVLLPKVGEPAPEYMSLYAREGDGEVFRLSDLEGEPLWLNFWGSWCPPCRAEMPELQAAWEDLEPRGMNMIGVSQQEDPRTSVAYADRVGATFPIAVDPNYLTSVADPEAFPDLFETAQTWEIRNFPTHVFVNRDGIVVAVVLNQLTTECFIEYSELAMGERDDVDRSCTASG